MSLENLTRICLLVSRKKGLSEADFHKHWANNHGPLVTGWLIRYGIVRYTQFHVTPEHRAMGQAIGVAPQFDGIAEFIVHKYEDMENAYADPEYLEKIRPDELAFLDPEKIVFSVGVDYIVIDDNKAAGSNRLEF